MNKFQTDSTNMMIKFKLKIGSKKNDNWNNQFDSRSMPLLCDHMKTRLWDIHKDCIAVFIEKKRIWFNKKETFLRKFLFSLSLSPPIDDDYFLWFITIGKKLKNG